MLLPFDAIRHENSLLRHKLAKAGVDGVLLAAELEFTSFPNISSTEHSQAVKQSVLNTLEEMIQSPIPREERVALAARKTEISKFNAREVMMYDSLNDPRISDMLEPLFGTSRAGDGYYDAEGVLELKIRPCDEHEFGKRIHLITDVLKEKAEHYGFNPALIDAAGVHLSYSFHDEQGNIFAPNTHAPDKFQKITTGVSYVLQDMAKVLDGNGKLSGPSAGLFRVHPGREEKIRIAPHRMELRLHKVLKELDIDAISMAVMAGAAYGLNPKDRSYYTQHVPKTTLVQVPQIKNSDPSIKMLQHILEGCIVGKDGHLVPPEQYIWEGAVVKGGAAAVELGFINYGATSTNDYPSTEVIKKIEKCISSDGVMDIFKNIRVIAAEDGGYKLEWPQDRLLIRVMDPNDFFKIDGPRVPFDARHLEKTLRITGLRTATATDRENASPGRDWGQLHLNKALQETLSPAVYGRLTDGVKVPPAKTDWGLGAAVTKKIFAVANRGERLVAAARNAFIYGQN